MPTPFGYDGNITAALNVTDLDRSIAWYQSVLGFELLYKMEDMGWCEFSTPTKGVNVGLSVTEEAKHGGGATLTFGVDDIADAHAQLIAKHVRIDGAIQTIPGMVSLVTFFDPDDNQLMLAQDLSG